MEGQCEMTDRVVPVTDIVSGMECSTCDAESFDVTERVSDVEAVVKCRICGVEWGVKIVAQTVLSDG